MTTPPRPATLGDVVRGAYEPVWRVGTIALCVSVGVLALGCRADLPPCDAERMAAARKVAFRASGAPVYEGQALIRSSCGAGTFCHSPDAPPEHRFGVPKGLDFDVRPGYAQGAEALEEQRRKVRSHAASIATQIAHGWMPPGEIGNSDMIQAPRPRRGPAEDAERLPPVDSAEGERIVRQWLACDAPVVESTREPMGGEQGGEPCGRGPADVGDCVVSAPPR